jgi:hypothetical protein
MLFTNNVNNICLKDKVRRYTHWIIWEKYKDESNTYKEFKNNWNPNKKKLKKKLLIIKKKNYQINIEIICRLNLLYLEL